MTKNEEKILYELKSRRNSTLEHKVQLQQNYISLLQKVDGKVTNIEELDRIMKEQIQIKNLINELDREFSIWCKAILIIEDIITGEE